MEVCTWRCHLCHRVMRTDHQRIRHMQNLWKSETDPGRCDKLLARQAAQQAVVPIIPAPNVPPALFDPLGELARRPRVNLSEAREARAAYTIRAAGPAIPDAIDLVQLQDRWDEYLQNLRGLCTTKFWKIFLSLHTLSGVAIDRALHAVKEAYVKPADRSKFPISRRALFKSMGKMSPFWTHVSHTVRIDLSQFALPSGTKHIDFKFIDPIFAWVLTARDQDPLDMHWKPVAQRPLHETYGGGIQFGTFFFPSEQDYPTRLLCDVYWTSLGRHGRPWSEFSAHMYMRRQH